MMRSLQVACITALSPVFAMAEVPSETHVLEKAMYKDMACVEDNGDAMSCICEVDATYLQLKDIAHAEAINRLLKADAAQAVRDDEGKPFCAGTKIDAKTVGDDISITSLQYDQVLQFQNDELLVLGLNIWSFWEGAAHGNGATQFHTFDRATGEELTLDAMIDTAQIDAINHYIHDTLKTMPESFLGAQVADGEKVSDTPDEYLKGEAAEVESLSVGGNGVAVYFPAYAVGPYSSGDIYVELPERFVRLPALRKLYGKKH